MDKVFVILGAIFLIVFGIFCGYLTKEDRQNKRVWEQIYEKVDTFHFDNAYHGVFPTAVFSDGDKTEVHVNMDEADAYVVYDGIIVLNSTSNHKMSKKVANKLLSTINAQEYRGKEQRIKNEFFEKYSK